MKMAASAEKPHPQQGTMDPRLLALVFSGSCEKLEALLISREASAVTTNINGSFPKPASPSEKLQTALDIFSEEVEASASSDDDDRKEANNASSSILLEGMTAEGDTALHVVDACGHGDNNLFTSSSSREAKHLLLPVQQNHNNRRWMWWLTRAERHELSTYGHYGDSDNFLETARIIYGKAKHLLFAQNKNGDTALHCAARAGKSRMVKCLIDLALADERGEARMKELLRKENKHKETALHEAVRVGDNKIVHLLMDNDSELASFPTAQQQDSGGASPVYIAFALKRFSIANALAQKSNGNISFAGPNGQNVLHAAVLVSKDLTELLEWIETRLGQQNKDHITKQEDENGSTPLHFAAAIEKPSRICRQVLEANPDALYQPDHAGFFPIHVAASVGASCNVSMFVTRYPGSAGLGDAKGRTFLHVAVEKKEVKVVKIACRNLSLLWIMNMVDNDGNTALHLAVEKRSLVMFCHLMPNPQVMLNLRNNKGDTPLDIAEYNFPKDRLYYNKNTEVQIRNTLRIAGATKGVRRQDHLLEDHHNRSTVRVNSHDNNDEGINKEALKESTQINSVYWLGSDNNSDIWRNLLPLVAT